MQRRNLIGLVLGGGGARGAYEAGVLSGLNEVLDKRGMPLQLDVLCGSSIGALNAAWLAAHAHEHDRGIPGLVEEWASLELEDSLRLHSHLWSPRVRAGAPRSVSLLDPSAVETLTRDRIPWTQLHYNVASGAVHALIVTALNIATGRTTSFAQLAPNASYRPSRDPRRNAELVRMGADHVLASSAFPWVFPARELSGEFFCDGGLRFNTPISPALRTGSERLVVISLLAKGAPVPRTVALQRQRLVAFPSPVFLLGKLLAALLLDPIEYDLLVLERFNRLVEVLEDHLEPHEMTRVQEVLTSSRGVSYRRVPTLVFQPSHNLGAMASDFLERSARPSVRTRMLKRISRLGSTWEADLMSFILLDGQFSEQLIELGRGDVRAREDEVVRFFSEA